jgi:hypothetical protein
MSGVTAASSVARNPVPSATRYSATRSGPASPLTVAALDPAAARIAATSAGENPPRRRRWSRRAFIALSRRNGFPSVRPLSVSHRANWWAA